MDELATLLKGIEDTYYDFELAILQYAKKKQTRLSTVLTYIKNHPEAKTSDVIEFISEQDDFFEG